MRNDRVRRYALTTARELPLSTALHTTGLPAELSGAAVHAVLTERFEDAAAVTETYRIRIRAGAVQESAGHTAGATERIVVLRGTAWVGERAGPPRRVGPGGHAHWAADVPHLYRAAEEDVDALLVVRYPRPAVS
ncbi:cupin domain-containing protein [Streptomyces lavendulae]|uniref:cupin domain-containing protein n=1 Tax=Streptomyces lavendulae TaxID=1914 RepID=UPI0036E2754A